ncbi:VOC family protein [Hellea sp.]|nr:VOC family protein [Hellea sp.]
MAKILGLGGVFFICKDVEAYRKWWKVTLEVDITDWGTMEWKPDGKGRTMFSPFANDSTYLEPSKERFMVNLRVDDVKTLIEKARNGGAKICGDVEDTEFGIFGWFIDPEGIKIELWQEN